MNGLGEFAPVLEEALEVENIDEVGQVAWLGDGAVCNWTLADQLCPDAVQILDWHHAVEHAVDCAKVLLGEESPWLAVWQRRSEELLAAGDPDAVISEFMECVPLVPRGRGQREPSPPPRRYGRRKIRPEDTPGGPRARWRSRSTAAGAGRVMN